MIMLTFGSWIHKRKGNVQVQAVQPNRNPIYRAFFSYSSVRRAAGTEPSISSALFPLSTAVTASTKVSQVCSA
jgi:hypothetical protein